MSTATVTSKGQITIPIDIRDRLKIETGDQLVFNVDLAGQVHVRVRRSRVGAGRGMIPCVDAEVTRAAIGEAVAEGVAKRLKRSRSVGRAGTKAKVRTT